MSTRGQDRITEQTGLEVKPWSCIQEVLRSKHGRHIGSPDCEVSLFLYSNSWIIRVALLRYDHFLSDYFEYTSIILSFDSVTQKSSKKIIISPACGRARPENMLDKIESFAGWTEQHLQEAEGTNPYTYVSRSSSSHSAQLGYLTHMDTHYWKRIQKITTSLNFDYMRIFRCQVRHIIISFMWQVLVLVYLLFFIWFVRLLVLRPLLAYCAGLGW
jgi:hypothetical protein